MRSPLPCSDSSATPSSPSQLECAPPRDAHGDLTSLAPHERLPEILVMPRVYYFHKLNLAAVYRMEVRMAEVKEGEEVGSLADHHPIKKMVVA